MKTSKGSIAGLLVLALAASTAFAADDTYTLKLQRPEKVGGLYDTHIVLEENQTTNVKSPDGPQAQQQALKGDFTGRAEVREVARDGEATSLLITVKKFIDADGKELIPAGKELQIKRGQKETTAELVGGGQLSDDARKILSEMFPKHDPNGPSDDEMFGTLTPRKVGDTWPVNAEALAKTLADAGLTLDPKNVKGTMTLKAVETVGTTKMLRLTGTVDVKDFKPPTPDPSIKVESGNLSLDYSGLLPVDPAQMGGELMEKVTMDMHMTAGPGVTIDVKAQNTHTETRTPIKK